MDLTPACRGMDPDIFFNEKHRTQALKVCNSCPIQLSCALDHSTDRSNVVIGSTGSGRRLLRKWRASMNEAQLFAELRRYNDRQIDGGRGGRELVAWRSQPDEWIRAVREHRARTGEPVDAIALRFNCSTTGIKTILRGEARREAGGPMTGPPVVIGPERRAEMEKLILPLRAEGLTNAQIAERLDMPRGDVRCITRRHSIDSLQKWRRQDA